MNFRYQVRDPLGRTFDGTVAANSLDDAGQILRRDGFQVLQLQEGDDQEGGLLPRRVKRSDIVYTTSQLAIMVETGISLSAALDGIAQQEENPTLRQLLGDLKSRVEGGDDFSTALSKHPKYFDKTYVALVRASEQTGTLGEMLDRIANYLRGELESRAKVRAALAYPVVMLVLAVSVTIFLLTFVMPKFTPLFTRKGITLPKPTIVLMTVSDALINYWWAWLAAAIALVVGYLYGRRTEPGRQILDWIKINLPVLGPMFRKVTLSRSIRTLGTMISSGVSMLDAVRLSADVSGNYYYEKSWLHVLDQITQGHRICDALKGDSLFPSTLVQMIGSGEDTGKLDHVLQRVSTFYDREVEVSLKTATSLIEPLMITAMGGVIGTIGLSIMLPIFSLSRTAG